MFFNKEKKHHEGNQNEQERSLTFSKVGKKYAISVLKYIWLGAFSNCVIYSKNQSLIVKKKCVTSENSFILCSIIQSHDNH